MLKKAMNIKWEDPTLNKNLKHADLTLSFWCYCLCSTGLFQLFYSYYYYFNFFRTFCILILAIISMFFNFLPSFKCSARASVIQCLALLKIVR